MRPRYEEHHRVEITDEAIEAAAKLAKRYVADRFLPDKAIDLIDEAASLARIKRGGSSKALRNLQKQVTEIRDDIENAVFDQDFELAARLKTRESASYRTAWLSSSSKRARPTPPCAFTPKILPEGIAHDRHPRHAPHQDRGR